MEHSPLKLPLLFCFNDQPSKSDLSGYSYVFLYVVRTFPWTLVNDGQIRDTDNTSFILRFPICELFPVRVYIHVAVTSSFTWPHHIVTTLRYGGHIGRPNTLNWAKLSFAVMFTAYTGLLPETCGPALRSSLPWRNRPQWNIDIRHHLNSRTQFNVTKKSDAGKFWSSLSDILTF